MSRFIVTLTEEQRANIEAWRVKLGLRSAAAVIQHWASRHPELNAAPAPRLVTAAEALDIVAKGAPHEPLMVDPETMKRRDFKSRLKGEWKAP